MRTYIQINPADNVVVAVKNLQTGVSLDINGRTIVKVCQNSHLLFYTQSPDFHKLGLCYNLKILYL